MVSVVQMLLLTCIPLVLDMSSFCLEVICIRLWEDNQNNLRILRHTWAPFVSLPSFLSRSVYTAFWLKFLSPVECHFLKCDLVFGSYAWAWSRGFASSPLCPTPAYLRDTHILFFVPRSSTPHHLFPFPIGTEGFPSTSASGTGPHFMWGYKYRVQQMFLFFLPGSCSSPAMLCAGLLGSFWSVRWRWTSLRNTVNFSTFYDAHRFSSLVCLHVIFANLSNILVQILIDYIYTYMKYNWFIFSI